jgi:hypothetical protein
MLTAMWRTNVKTMLRLHGNAFNTDWTLKATYVDQQY